MLFLVGSGQVVLKKKKKKRKKEKKRKMKYGDILSVVWKNCPQSNFAIFMFDRFSLQLTQQIHWCCSSLSIAYQKMHVIPV